MKSLKTILRTRGSKTEPIGRSILGLFWVRRLMSICWYVVGVAVCYYVAFALRFDGRIGEVHWILFLNTLPVLLAIRIAIFIFFDLYSGIWRFISLKDVVRMVTAIIASTIVFALIYYFQNSRTFSPFPRSVFIIDAMLYVLYCVGGRTSLRLVREMGMLDKGPRRPVPDWRDKSIVVGDLLHVNALLSSLDGDITVRRSIVGILCPEGQEHRGESIHGVKIIGSDSEAGEKARKFDIRNILLVEPFTSPNELKNLTDQCARAGARVQLRMIPSVSDLVGNKLSVSNIKNVDIEDLLGRPSITFDNENILQLVKDKVILVTGAGGSIGSELCRQILRYDPKKLILVENNECALYHIDHEVGCPGRKCKVVPIAADIRFEEELSRICSQYSPEILFHAAAYKHVPLMENNIAAAFRTNVLGTASVANAAVDSGVKRVVLVSSDKAVRPTSIMGATKRLAERVVLESPKGNTEFIAVRFGNVIGSSGSVVPLFKQQIAAGGPLTVTTENVTRYFMTIPESVDLMLQASALAADRDILVLEMGAPVKIDVLARRLVELSGYVPDVDIKIKYIGLRPGEKEYEELLTKDENVVRTPFDKIWVLQSGPDKFNPPSVDLELIQSLVNRNDGDQLRQLATDYIPENNFSIVD